MILLELLWVFAQVGFTSFGGMSMIPLVYDQMLSRSWLTAGEVSDVIAIAEMTPGSFGINCATFAGMRTAGMAGAAVASLGVMLPSLTLCVVAALCIQRFQGSALIQHALTGIRPVCLGMIVTSAVSLAMENYLVGSAVSVKSIGIGLIAAFLILKCRWSVPKVIGISALLGVILFSLPI